MSDVEGKVEKEEEVIVSMVARRGGRHTCLKWPKLETQVGGPEPEPEQIFSKTANF